MNKQERKIKAINHYNLINEVYPNEINECIKNSTIIEKANPITDLSVKYPVTALYKISKDMKTCVLNFASYTNPGGGFLNGSSAQEEALCMDSLMYPILESFKESFYKKNKESLNNGLYSSRCVYTPNVIFMKHDKRIADVLTIAAPNLARFNGDKNQVEPILKDRVNSIMCTTALHSVDFLILGAFGCGVFKNDPKLVASLFKEWIQEHDGVFKMIVFAIPGGVNYKIFNKILKG